MRNFDAIAVLSGDGLRPELRALLDRAAIEPRSELFVRSDGMLQSGPDATPKPARDNVVPLKTRAASPKESAGVTSTPTCRRPSAGP
ncbi:hypothetical protein [Bradyrhizobium sp. CER78]|uniref:hypothetical protein n=1 Tax=Bradyrhizobium sp. CER78 TaxID=3039162 RepID=UPI002447FDD4|nr:hypothetical protein [Bradyrhizobium sp. CER78]MDH2383819.1 hypothetical protein [Bradyrhizobium sp. CER78]